MKSDFGGAELAAVTMQKDKTKLDFISVLCPGLTCATWREVFGSAEEIPFFHDLQMWGLGRTCLTTAPSTVCGHIVTHTRAHTRPRGADT